MKRSAIALSAALLALGGCGSPATTPTFTESFEPLDSSQDVVFSIEGSARTVSLTLGVGTATSQKTNVAVPLRENGRQGLTVTVSPGTFLYISAQNEDETGSVLCKITVDGVVISTTSSEGAFVIASCSGTS